MGTAIFSNKRQFQIKCLVLALCEVEVIKVPDPHDPADHVRPAPQIIGVNDTLYTEQDDDQQDHACGQHRVQISEKFRHF